MKNKLKSILIFSLSVNIILFSALAMESYDRHLKATAAENAVFSRNETIREMCRSLLLSSEKNYKNGDFARARAYLLCLQYTGAENEYFSEICGAADVCFFEKEKDDSYAYSLMLSIIGKLLDGEILSDGDKEALDSLLSEYTSLTFDSSSYSTIESGLPVNARNAKRTAERLFGKGITLHKATAALFPSRYSFSGGSSITSVSKNGGKITEHYFSLSPNGIRISEDDALKSAHAFLENVKLSGVKLKSIVASEGMYYLIFEGESDSSRTLKLMLSGESGRVCYFDSKAYYRDKEG